MTKIAFAPDGYRFAMFDHFLSRIHLVNMASIWYRYKEIMYMNLHRKQTIRLVSRQISKKVQMFYCFERRSQSKNLF